MAICRLGNNGCCSGSNCDHTRCCHSVRADSCPVAVMHTNDILIGGCPCNGLIRGVQRIKGDRKLYAAVSRDSEVLIQHIKGGSIAPSSATDD